MNDEIEFQTWICPKCFNDHFKHNECSEYKHKEFMPFESDKSYIAEMYRCLIKERDELKAQLNSYIRSNNIGTKKEGGE